MTNKEMCLHNLHTARFEHSRWMSKIQLLASGEEEISNLGSSFFETPFGLWFHYQASYFMISNCKDTLSVMKILLRDIDKNYIALYKITVLDRKTTLFGKTISLSELELEKVERYHQRIIDLSDRVLEKMNHFEQIILNKDEKELDSFAEHCKKQEKVSPKKKTSTKFTGARGSSYE